MLPVYARRPAGWLLIVCAIVVAVLGVLVAGRTRADSFDNAVDSPIIDRFGGHQHLLLWLAAPGTRTPAFVATAVVVTGCLLARRRGAAVLAALAVPLAVGLDEYVLKPLVHRTYLGSLVYPSGHTTAVVSLAAALTVVLAPAVFAGVRPAAGGFVGVRPVAGGSVAAGPVAGGSVAAGLVAGGSVAARPAAAGPARSVWRWLAALVIVAAWLDAIVVAVAVIALRWHYFSDTVAGAAVGIGTVCAVALILDLPRVRRWLR